MRRELQEYNHQNEELDFANFVEYARSALEKKIPEAHIAANSLAVAINRVAALLTYYFDANVHYPRDSSWASYRVLFALWLAGPLQPHKAGEVIGMGKSAVSNLPKALVQRGLVAETPSREDKR